MIGGSRTDSAHQNPQTEVGKRPKGRPPAGHRWDGLRYVPLGFPTATPDELSAYGKTEEAAVALAEQKTEAHAESPDSPVKLLGEAPLAVRMPKAFEWLFGIPRGLMRTDFQAVVRQWCDLRRTETGELRFGSSSMRALLENGFNGAKPFGPIPLQHRKRVAMVLELCDLVETIMGE